MLSVERLCLRRGIKLFSRYELHTVFWHNTTIKLGEGGQGSCVRVFGQGFDWVVKEYKGDDAYEMLEREVRLLSRVHDVVGVQKLAGVCLDNYTVITHYAGADIDNYLDKHGDCANTYVALVVLPQLARIVKDMASCGVYHNDIKTNNICIQMTIQGPEVTLIDLGLASTTMPIMEDPLPRDEMHKFPWIAPEVKAGWRSSLTSETYSVAFVAQDLMTDRMACLFPAFSRWVDAALSPDPCHRPPITHL